MFCLLYRQSFSISYQYLELFNSLKSTFLLSNRLLQSKEITGANDLARLINMDEWRGRWRMMQGPRFLRHDGRAATASPGKERGVDS